jgi:dTDP-4-dehydrorhamnose reductase
MMRVLVAGSAGQVARALAEAPHRGFTVRSFGRPEFDLERRETVEAAFADFRPDVVINAAAYTAVDKAETEPDVAMRINADGPALLAELAAKADAPILHLSTDYVFSGDKASPYVESDPVGPASAYGRSKLEGERRVAAANPKHLILRTAWVHAPYGVNFVRTMLRLAETRPDLGVVADQHGAPTYAPDIAEGLLAIVARIAKGGSAPWGIYHMASSGSCVWADFAEHVFACSAAAGGPSAKVKRIPTVEYPTPARRPANSRLDCGRLRSEYGVALPDWRSGVDRCVARLLAQRRTT